MLETIDEYDLPPTRSDATSIAKYLVGRKNRQLFVTSAAAIVVGVIHANWSGSHTVFPRYGAAVTLLAIVQSWRQLQYQKMLPKITQFQIDLFTGIEREKLGEDASEETVKVRAYKRVNRVLPTLYESILREFVGPALIVAFVGNLIWAFGDLLPLTTSLELYQ